MKLRKFWPLAVLAGIILVAAALRLWKLDSLPPGLMGDEAINGSDERMVLSGVGFPIYFAASNGREPLFLYLQALSMAIFGPSLFALRIVSASAGILTVAAVYYCSLQVFGSGRHEPAGQEDEPGFVIWQALLAATAMAVSYWALHISRLGLRAVLLPPVSAMAMALFWRAWNRDRRRDYIAAGLWFGVALYTYNSARLLPLVPAAFVIIEAAVDVWRGRGHPDSQDELRRVWRRRAGGLVLLAGACAVLLIPLAPAALRDPAVATGRAAQIGVFDSPSGSTGERLLQNAVLVARNFYDRGDLNANYNLPGRPVNDPLLALLFTLGWIGALWRIRQSRYRLLLLWLAIMLLPTVMTINAPHNLRAAGALPPLAMLYAAGGGWLLGYAHRPALRRYGLPVIAAATALFSGSLTVHDYFNRWATLPMLGDIFYLNRQLAAQTVAELLQREPQQVVLMPQRLYAQPNMVFELGLPAQTTLPESWVKERPKGAFVVDNLYDPDESLALLWRDAGGIKVAPVEAPTDRGTGAWPWLSQQQPGAAPIRAPLHQPAWPYVYTGPLPGDVPLQPRTIANPRDIAFANGLRLLGYGVRPHRSPGDARASEFDLTLFWQLPKSKELQKIVSLQPFVHLANEQGVWQTDMRVIREAYLLPWNQAPGVSPRVVEDVRVLAAPEGMPAGRAFFEVGLQTDLGPVGSALNRVNIVDSLGRSAGDTVKLGGVMVGTSPPQADMADLRPMSARFAGSVELVGWLASRDAGRPDTLNVELGWRALAHPGTDYTTFVHLIDSAGNIISQDDRPPSADVPTSLWVPGETRRSVFTVKVPVDASPDNLKLRIGLYEPVSGAQAPVQVPGTSSAEQRNTFLVLPLPQAK